MHCATANKQTHRTSGNYFIFYTNVIGAFFERVNYHWQLQVSLSRNRSHIKVKSVAMFSTLLIAT